MANMKMTAEEALQAAEFLKERRTDFIFSVGLPSKEIKFGVATDLDIPIVHFVYDPDLWSRGTSHYDRVQSLIGDDSFIEGIHYVSTSSFSEKKVLQQTFAVVHHSWEHFDVIWIGEVAPSSSIVSSLSATREGRPKFRFDPTLRVDESTDEDVELRVRCFPFVDLISERKFHEFETSVAREENLGLLKYLVGHYISGATGGGLVHHFVIRSIVDQIVKIGGTEECGSSSFWEPLWRSAFESMPTVRQAIWDAGGKEFIPRGTDPYILEDREISWEHVRASVLAEARDEA